MLFYYGANLPLIVQFTKLCDVYFYFANIIRELLFNIIMIIINNK